MDNTIANGYIPHKYLPAEYAEITEYMNTAICTKNPKVIVAITGSFSTVLYFLIRYKTESNPTIPKLNILLR